MAEPRKSLKKVDGEKMSNGVYHATFNNGKVFVADLRQLPVSVDSAGNVTAILGEDGYNALPPMVKQTLHYGIKQKLDDSMAGAESEDEAFEEVSSTWEAITKGNWTMRVAGEGVEGGLFARAYAQRHEISLADAKAKIGGIVKKNLDAAQAKENAKPEKERKEITERMIFNAVRDFAKERDADLARIYDEIKAKRQKKSTPATRPEIEL